MSVPRNRFLSALQREDLFLQVLCCHACMVKICMEQGSHETRGRQGGEVRTESPDEGRSSRREGPTDSCCNFANKQTTQRRVHSHRPIVGIDGVVLSSLLLGVTNKRRLTRQLCAHEDEGQQGQGEVGAPPSTLCTGHPLHGASHGY